jgi:hypothetical protein
MSWTMGLTMRLAANSAASPKEAPGGRRAMRIRYVAMPTLSAPLSQSCATNHADMIRSRRRNGAMRPRKRSGGLTVTINVWRA